ncbi:MAG TPA: glycosyltransferase family 39 protein, partial [Candidatus Dormibacteraeota bacterium]
MASVSSIASARALDEPRPDEQPAWALPALLVLAVFAAVVYGWGIASTQLHLYYGPAVKSMSESWRAFLFGAYDPAAWSTVDKLPGAFWVQALSARIFGFHAWSVLLPPVVESVLTIFVLYRVVRRWLGPGAGLVAAAVFATTPIVAAMARTQISDVLLVLLLVLAAAAWQRAVSGARLLPLLLCGLCVGLAFYTKMAQAWAVWIPFGVAYLAAAPTSLSRRLSHVALAGGVTLVVSLAWVGFMLATPASARPYVDGSMDNSPISMVFGYNALNRFGVGHTGAEALGVGGPAKRADGPLTYLIGNGVAPQIGWLYPLALIGLAGVFARGGRTPRDDARAPAVDPVRAGYLMWGLWFVVHAVAFSVARLPHTFYLIALAPAEAALAAGGLVLLVSAYRRDGWRQWLLPAAIAITAVWCAYLCSRFPAFLPWLGPSLLVAGIAAAAVLVAAKLVRGRAAAWLGTAGGALAIVAILFAPGAWAASTVAQRDVFHAHRPGAGPASR